GYNGNFNDEYIEIMNLGDLPANLSGYTLEYYESDLLETVNLTGSIDPYNAYVIAARTTHTSAITPNIVSSTTFKINNPCYVILKKNGVVVNQAGTENDKFDAKNNNFELTKCSSDNLFTENWDNLYGDNGTPGIVNCLSNIETELNTDVILFPNPVHSTLHINNLTVATPIEIYNVFGQKVATYLEGTNEINVSDYSDGIYIMRLVNLDNKTVRFIKSSN
ncbi:MAG: T9SS type A sorting domain-containing protein, partial [Salinivirgaceae bacterium]|nr:T9SS type A sorting domain-containing protein [Salinivirgaceae bacterium]